LQLQFAQPTNKEIPMTQREPFIRRWLGASDLSAALLTLEAALWPSAAAQSAGTVTLTVHVTGARNAKGKIRAALFERANGFPNDASQAIQAQAADIDPHTLRAQIVFTGLHEGVYAVSVFRDENMNQKLDKNFMGIPKEGYGASDNPKKKMSPPSFEETNSNWAGRSNLWKSS
jgi:uncharacterized protein (DUF2141 family)